MYVAPYMHGNIEAMTYHTFYFISYTSKMKENTSCKKKMRIGHTVLSEEREKRAL